MSSVLNYYEYSILLIQDDENTVKAVLQQIFELLVKGHFFPKSTREAFKRLLEKHVTSPSQKVRKWAYHCACFYYNDNIHRKIKTQLQKETARENIMWALTALSIVYEDVKNLRECAGSRHEEFLSTISDNYLSDALYLFGVVVDINPKTILLTQNSADLVALTKIYGYPDLIRGKYPTITESIMHEIKNHPDAYVREYAYWALFLGGSTESHLMESDDKTADVRKFQIALQIQNGDKDFVISALNPLRKRPGIVHGEIKRGILRGLSKIAFIPDIAQYIGGWFSDEDDYSISCSLLEYMITHCCANRDDGTFFDVIQDSLNDETLKDYIVSKIRGNPGCKLTISGIENEYTLDFAEKGFEHMAITVSGTGNTVTTGNRNNVSVIHVSGENVSMLEEAIAETKKQAAKAFSNEELQMVNESLECIESEAKAEKPKKFVMKQMVDSLKALKGPMEFVTAVAKLAEVILKFL